MVRSKPRYMKSSTEAGDQNPVSACYGFMQMHKRSAILRSWMDWSLLLHDDGSMSSLQSLQNSLGVSDHTSHIPLAREKNEAVRAVKLAPPLRVECKESVGFVLSPPPFCLQNLNMPSGILNFKDQHSLSIFAYLDTTGTKRWDFKMGDHMLAITAMSDRPIKVNNNYNKKYFDELIERGAPLSKRCSFIKKINMNKESSHD